MMMGPLKKVQAPHALCCAIRRASLDKQPARIGCCYNQKYAELLTSYFRHLISSSSQLSCLERRVLLASGPPVFADESFKGN